MTFPKGKVVELEGYFQSDLIGAIIVSERTFKMHNGDVCQLVQLSNGVQAYISIQNIIERGKAVAAPCPMV